MDKLYTKLQSARQGIDSSYYSSQFQITDSYQSQKVKQQNNAQNIQESIKKRISEVRTQLKTKRESTGKYNGVDILSQDYFSSKSPIRHSQISNITQMHSIKSQSHFSDNKFKSSFSPTCAAGQNNHFFKKVQPGEKKGFNEQVVAQQNYRLEAQDNSMDSLLQICKILPDSKSKHKITQGTQKPHTQAFQTTSKPSTNSQSFLQKENYSQSYLTLSGSSTARNNLQQNQNIFSNFPKYQKSQVDDYQNGRMSFAPSAKPTLLQEIKSKEQPNRKSLHSYLSKDYSEKYTDARKTQPQKPLFQREDNILKEKQLKLQEQNNQLDAQDLRAHLDNFLKINESRRNANTYQSKDIYASFAAPILESYSNNSKQQSNYKKSVKENQQPLANPLEFVNHVLNSQVTVTSPTPKFSINLEYDQKNDIVDIKALPFKKNPQQMQKQHRLSILSEKSNVQSSQHQQIEQPNFLNSPFKQINSDEKISLQYQSRQRSENKEQVRSLSQSVKNNTADKYKRKRTTHKKSKSKANEIYFTSKLQWENVNNFENVFSTHQEKRRQASWFQDPKTENILLDQEETDCSKVEDVTIPQIQIISPISEMGIDINKQNVLQRTASLDLYLNNAKSFLVGHRFISPKSKYSSSKSGRESLISKKQIQNYLAKLIFKKLVNHQRKQMLECFVELKSQPEKKKVSQFEQKLSILNFIREFLLKQEAFKLWHEMKKLSDKDACQRKGFGLIHLIDVVTKIFYKESFVKLQQSQKSILQEEDLVHSFRTRQQKIRYFSQWYNAYRFQQLSKRRNLLFQRIVGAIVMKVKIQQTFEQLKLNHLRNRDCSLNLKIKEQILNMSFSNDSTTEAIAQSHKQKLLRFLSINQLQTVFNRIRNQRASELFQQLKLIKVTQDFQGKVEEICKRKDEENQLLKLKIRSQQATLQKMGAKLLVSTMKNVANKQKSKCFGTLEQHSRRVNALCRVQKVLSHHYSKVSYEKYFANWKQICHDNQENHQRLLVASKHLIQKAYEAKLRSAFKKWKKVNLQDFEMHQLKTQELQNLFKNLFDQKKSIKRCFEQLRIRAKSYKLLSTVYHKYRELSVKNSFQEWKNKCLHGKLMQKLRLPSLIIKKGQDHETFLINKYFQIFKQFNQLQSLQKQSHAQTAAQQIIRLMRKLQTENVQDSFRLIKKIYKKDKLHIKIQHDALLKALNHHNKTICHSKRQAFQIIKQFTSVKSKQVNSIQRLLKRIPKQQKNLYFRAWKQRVINLSQISSKQAQIEIQRNNLLQKIASTIKLRQISVYLNRWRLVNKIHNNCIQRKQTQIQLSGASKIINLLHQKNSLKCKFSKWRQTTNSLKLFKCSFNILNHLQKRKRRLYFSLFIDNLKNRELIHKQNEIKSVFLGQIMLKLSQRKLRMVFGKLLDNYKEQIIMSEQALIQQKKDEIDQQYQILQEKDSKIKNQEAFLHMKEKGMIEQEKELRDKSKRIIELSKQFNQTKKHNQSRSPTRFLLSKTPKQFAQPAIQKSFSSKQEMQQFQSMSQATQQTTSDCNLMTMDQTSFNQMTIDSSRQMKVENYPLQKSIAKKACITISQTQNSLRQSQQNIGKENSAQKMPVSHSSSMGFGMRKTSHLSQSTTGLNLRSSVNLSTPSSALNLNSTRGNHTGSSKTKITFQQDVLQQKLFRTAALQLAQKVNQILLRKKSQTFNSLRQATVSQRQKEGVGMMIGIMRRRILSDVLVQWLKNVYYEEIMVQETYESIREQVIYINLNPIQKLLRAIIIGEKTKNSDKALMMKAFKEWRRLEYTMVLEGLRQYSATLEKVSHMSNYYENDTSRDYYQPLKKKNPFYN